MIVNKQFAFGTLKDSLVAVKIYIIFFAVVVVLLIQNYQCTSIFHNLNCLNNSKNISLDIFNFYIMFDNWVRTKC